MRVALAQLVADPDPARNLRQVADLTAAAAAQGAELVVFPEATMRCFGRSLTEVAEPFDGPWATAVRAVAAEHGVVVVVGLFTPAPDGRVTNTLLVTGPGVEARYDKIHLFDAYGFRESDTVTPGDAAVTVRVGGVTVGLATCYDLRFPALFTALAEQGAEIVVVPASWGSGPGKLEQWRLLLRARAVDTTTYVLGVGQADPTTVDSFHAQDGTPAPTAPTGIGHSGLAGPTGELLVELGAAPELAVLDVDLSGLADVRQALPVLANRRPIGG